MIYFTEEQIGYEKILYDFLFVVRFTMFGCFNLIFRLFFLPIFQHSRGLTEKFILE